jgi:hypothetical protein
MPPAEFDPAIPTSEWPWTPRLRPRGHWDRHIHNIALFSQSQLKGKGNGKGKAVPYRPRKALRAPAGRGSQVFKQSAHEGGKVVSPTHRPPLPPRKDSRYSFLSEAESTPGP